MIKFTKSPFNCWQGYERVPGTKAGTKVVVESQGHQ